MKMCIPQFYHDFKIRILKKINNLLCQIYSWNKSGFKLSHFLEYVPNLYDRDLTIKTKWQFQNNFVEQGLIFLRRAGKIAPPELLKSALYIWFPQLLILICTFLPLFKLLIQILKALLNDFSTNYIGIANISFAKKSPTNHRITRTLQKWIKVGIRLDYWVWLLTFPVHWLFTEYFEFKLFSLYQITLTRGLCC